MSPRGKSCLAGSSGTALGRCRLEGVALSPDGKYLVPFGRGSLWLVEVETKKAVKLNSRRTSIHSRRLQPGRRQLGRGRGPGRSGSGRFLPATCCSTMHFFGGCSWDWLSAPMAVTSRPAFPTTPSSCWMSADGREIVTLRGHAGKREGGGVQPERPADCLRRARRDDSLLGHHRAPGRPAVWSFGGSEGSRSAATASALTAIAPQLLTWELTTGRKLFQRDFGNRVGTWPDRH